MRARILPRPCVETSLLQEVSEATRQHRRPGQLDQQSTGRRSRVDAL